MAVSCISRGSNNIHRAETGRHETLFRVVGGENVGHAKGQGDEEAEQEDDELIHVGMDHSQQAAGRAVNDHHAAPNDNCQAQHHLDIGELGQDG